VNKIIFVAIFTAGIFAGRQVWAQGICNLSAMTDQQKTSIEDLLSKSETTQKQFPAAPAPVIKAAADCVSAIESTARAAETAMYNTDAANNNTFCNIQGNSATANTKLLQTSGTTAVAGYTAGQSAARGAFSGAGASTPAAGGAQQSPASSGDSSGQNICATTCNTAIQTAVQNNPPPAPTGEVTAKSVTYANLAPMLNSNCLAVAKQVDTIFTQKIQYVTGLSTSAGLSSTQWALIGAGSAAAIGGVVALTSGGSNKGAQAAAAAQATQLNNGYACPNSAAGTPQATCPTSQMVNCTTGDNYETTQCTNAMLNLCSQSANAGTGACTSFNNYYCGESGASSSYCTITANSILSNYCSGAVSTTSGLTVAASSASSANTNSPACVWLSQMPATCPGSPVYSGTSSTISSNANSVACLPTTAQLANCANYASDPLCTAYANNTITTNSNSTTTATTTVGSTTVTTGSTGSTTSASTSGATAGGFNSTTLPSSQTTYTATTLEAFTGTTAQTAPSRNLFSEQKRALASVCSQMLGGCH